MRILVQITNSITSYLNNAAAAYKRVQLKGRLPKPLQEKFENQLMELAKTADEIRDHVNKLPE